MANSIKSQAEILTKLGITQLNPMQQEALTTIQSNDEVVLLSPTGTGKTLAFLLPILATLKEEITNIQALIIVPSRELSIQIEQVIREMGTGFKTNAIYGGRAGSKDKEDIKHPPAILIGTPGRIADHIRRETFAIDQITTLVLDEFDKSLEVGFEPEMIEIIKSLPNIRKKILTSATQRVEIPEFVNLRNPKVINYLQEGESLLLLKTVMSPTKDKLDTLVRTLSHIGNVPGIIFCNFKETIQTVSDYLTECGISHGCFFGGMEQIDRERALIMFRNGTHQILIATDLAARGIDVPELKFIIHYQLPSRKEEFTHRNGRTARMKSDGTAYLLQWEKEQLPDFVGKPLVEKLDNAPVPKKPLWATLFISGGRRDKISKGDIAGLFLKQGQLNADELGVIEIKLECAFVAVHAKKVQSVIQLVNNQKLKTKKVRVSPL